MVDKEAKKATKNGTVTELKPSLTQIKCETRKSARKMRGEALKQRCESHGWLFLSGGQNHQPQLSRRELEALRRILTVSTRYAHSAPKCHCGRDISLQHALEGCATLKTSLYPLWDFRQRNRLKIQELLQPHPVLGELPVCVLVQTLLASETDHWFWASSFICCCCCC